MPINSSVNIYFDESLTYEMPKIHLKDELKNVANKLKIFEKMDIPVITAQQSNWITGSALDTALDASNNDNVRKLVSCYGIYGIFGANKKSLNHRIYNERDLKGFVPGVIVNLHRPQHFNPSYSWWNLLFDLQSDFDFTKGRSIDDIYGKISARESALAYHKYSYKKGDWRWSETMEDIQSRIQDGTIVNYVLLDDLKPLRKKMHF